MFQSEESFPCFDPQDDGNLIPNIFDFEEVDELLNLIPQGSEEYSHTFENFKELSDRSTGEDECPGANGTNSENIELFKKDDTPSSEIDEILDISESPKATLQISLPQSSENEDTPHANSGRRKKKGKTARKDSFSKNFYRDDKITKAAIRGMSHLEKTFFQREVKLYKKATKINLKDDSYAFYTWIRDFLYNHQAELRTNYDLIIDDKTALKIFSVLAYFMRVKTFKEYIKKGEFSESEKRYIIAEAFSFKRFNHPTRGTSDDRQIALSHPAITLAKFLYREDQDSQPVFWKKLTGRKNMAIQDKDQYKSTILKKLGMEL